MTKAAFMRDFDAFTIRNGKKPNAIMCDKTDSGYAALVELCKLNDIDLYECFTIPFSVPQFILI